MNLPPLLDRMLQFRSMWHLALCISMPSVPLLLVRGCYLYMTEKRVDLTILTCNFDLPCFSSACGFTPAHEHRQLNSAVLQALSTVDETTVENSIMVDQSPQASTSSSFSSSATSPIDAASPAILPAPAMPPRLPRPSDSRSLPAGTQPFTEAVMESMSLDMDLSPIDLVSLHQERWVSLRLSADALAHPEHQRLLIQRRLASDIELLRSATDCILL